jgi:metal-responsive CopG/Arc/MetJ family transcriptional regulator
MPTFEVQLPDDLYARFQRMAESEFISEREAYEELLGMGLDAYNVEEDEGTQADIADEYASEMWDTAEDPAERTDDTDEHTF